MEHSTVRRIIGEGNPFARHTGVEVAEVGEGSATCILAVKPHHLNPFGTVNAGAIYTLAETAFGAAANAHGAATVAVNLSIAYLSPATGPTLTATAEELSAGGRMATYSVRVFDADGTLAADVQAMGYRTGKPLPDPV
ncbi:MAG: PaaI family thioesterase [Pseudodesulfovibrio sp.]